MRKTGPDILALRRVPDGVEIELALSEDLLCLQGHFPGRPILPGIAQIDWAIGFADAHLGTEIGGARRLRVKFRAVIETGPPLILVLRRPAGKARLEFEYRQGDEIKSEGAVALDVAD